MEDYRAGLPAQERTSCGDYAQTMDWSAGQVRWRDLNIVGRVDGGYEGKRFPPTKSRQ